MVYKTRGYPLFAACGLNCGLCPRYYTKGTSRCPGCAGEGFSEVHPPCGILSCAQRKGLEYCFECDEFPCEKYEGVDAADSFITHRNQLRDMEKAKRMGIAAYKGELDAKVEALETLLANYDDGRRKAFYCTAINLLELQDVQAVMSQLGEKDKPADVARLFEQMAGQRGVCLKLRK